MDSPLLEHHSESGSVSVRASPEPVLSEPRPPVVRVSGFHKRYGKTEAVAGVALEVGRGEIYGLIGPDGAGKSTLMKSMAGVLAFDEGAIHAFDMSVDSERAAERVKARIGFLPQGLGLNLYPELSVEENVDFFARLRSVPRDDLAARKARLFGITRLESFRARPMKMLSGGMKQKLGLVCTLVHAPELLILDEPTTGVDPVSRRDFWAILSELIEAERTTAIVSTAYLDEASRFHRLSLLYAGRVLAAGSPEELLALVPGSLIVVHAQAGSEVVALAKLRSEFSDVQAVGTSLRTFLEGVPPDAAARAVENALADIVVEELRIEEPELEDVFVTLLRRGGFATTAGSPSAAEPVIAPIARHRMEAPLPRGNVAPIEAVGLTRDFGAFRAVDDVSFRVEGGEIFGLLGANGAGKTTVIKMLTGILRATAGEGRIAGVDMHRPAGSIKRRIGYMSQAFSLYTDLTVAENISLFAGIYGLGSKDARRRAEWICEMADLGAELERPVGALPMGMRQRLALGCALVHEPEVLFLDEPTSGVDPAGRRRFWDVLFRLAREENVAILVTTHYMNEAEHCDRLALMFAGRIVADASPSALKTAVEREAGRVLEITTDRPDVALARLRAAGYGSSALFGRRIHVLSHDPGEDGRRIDGTLVNAGVRVHAIQPKATSLEDVFVFKVTELERQSGNGAR